MSESTTTSSRPQRPRLLWLCLALQLLMAFVYYVRETMPVAEAPPAYDPRVEELKRTLEDQNRRIEELSIIASTVATPLDKEAVEALQKKVEALEAAMQAAQSQQSEAVQLLLSLDQLKSAVSLGKSYASTLSLVEKAAAPFPSLRDKIAALKASATHGIATIASLQAGFKQALQTQEPSRDASLLEGVKQNLASMVVVRKVGADHKGTDAASRIARAEAAINQRDVETAIAEIGALSKAERSPFTAWLQAATERMATAKALYELRKAAEDITRPQPSQPAGPSAAEDSRV